MPGPIVYRPLESADLPAARALWAQADGVELAEGDSPADLARFLARNPGLSQVACDDTGLVGAVLAGHDGRRGLLYHLAVAGSARGHGIGRELAARAVAGLRAAGIARVLILVARDNAAGRAFWVKQGWEPLDFAEPLGLDL